MELVTVISGGMDSTTLAYMLHEREHDQRLVSFDYGQRHAGRELACAATTAERLGLEHHVVDLRSLTALLGGSALTDSSVEVPHGHYAEQTMKQTVVPNRNAIMLNIAAGWAVAVGADGIATGVHAGDHFIYPDCRPEFIRALESMLHVATEGFASPAFTVFAPFLRESKDYIATVGDELGVPWGDTWSCYEGGDVHCGACGTCFERREAFAMAGVADPTEYKATPEYDAPTTMSGT